MMVYKSSLATPGTSSTSGTTNTEVGVISYKPASAASVASVALSAFQAQGAVSGGTTLNGIRFRCATFTTASTAGTATTPGPSDFGSRAAVTGAVTGQTISTTGRVNHWIVGCGVGGPGGWTGQSWDNWVKIYPNITTAPSVDVVSVAVALSLAFEWYCEHVE